MHPFHVALAAMSTREATTERARATARAPRAGVLSRPVVLPLYVAIAWLATACAKGTGEELTLENGVYELSTMTFEGDCVLDDAITPGGEYVGKVAMVSVDASDGSVRLQPCDDFFPDRCFPTAMVQSVSMIRDEVALYAENRQWEVPGCLCFDEWHGTRELSGTLTDDSRVELTWGFELPAPPAGCTCEAAACSATVTQRLALPSR